MNEIRGDKCIFKWRNKITEKILNDDILVQLHAD